jgi:site-specific recombinase XerD
VRGEGHIFQRGKRWWIAYYRDGILHREAGGATEEAAAKKLQKALRVADDDFLPVRERRLKVSDLLDALLGHLKAKGAASLSKAASHMQALRKAFGGLRANRLNTPTVEQYQVDRLATGRQPATVNRECELLRQAYRLAHRHTPPQVKRIPYIPLLEVENARQGFVSKADFAALLIKLTDPDVRDFVEWFWWTGMRPGEIRQLTWKMLDRETWTLHIEPRVAKTRRGRSIPIPGGPLRDIMMRRIQRRRFDCTLMFHRESKGKVGQPIKDFAKQWRAALKGANLPPGLIPYDLRRTALRNLVRGGTDFTVAMKISGHKTRSTFDRYNVVSEDDIRAALERTTAYVQTLPTDRNVEPFPEEHSQFIHNGGPASKSTSTRSKT